ncbi:MAG: hypothetical protein U0350_42285 [Caldilineaceae bacterium]
MNQGIARKAVTRDTSFDETVWRLSQSRSVEGVAEFGSRANARRSAASDYDLMIILRDLPIEVLQIVTAIDGRVADVVPIRTELVERIAAKGVDAAVGRFEEMFVQKLRTAQLLFDRVGTLRRAQTAVRTIPEERMLPKAASYGKRYREMFWQGFVIQQARRMARSDEEIHLLAAEMMLTSILTQTYRSYFELRGLTWEGEKTALRYWQQTDARCYQLVRELIRSTNLNERLATYERLSEHVLAGYGEPIREGQTAVMFALEPTESGVAEMLNYWDGLFVA